MLKTSRGAKKISYLLPPTWHSGSPDNTQESKFFFSQEGLALEIEPLERASHVYHPNEDAAAEVLKLIWSMWLKKYFKITFTLILTW